MSRTCEVAFDLEVCPGWQTVRQNASRAEHALQKQKKRQHTSRMEPTDQAVTRPDRRLSSADPKPEQRFFCLRDTSAL